MLFKDLLCVMMIFIYIISPCYENGGKSGRSCAVSSPVQVKLARLQWDKCAYSNCDDSNPTLIVNTSWG